MNQVMRVHYLPIGRKGRPTDPNLDIYRALFPEWSERTIARYAAAMLRLHLMGFSVEQKEDVIRKVTRQNRTLNVAKLDELTESMAAMRAAKDGSMKPSFTAKRHGSSAAGTATTAIGTATCSTENYEQNSADGSDWQRLAELPANCPLYRRAVVAVNRPRSARQRARDKKLEAIRQARETLRIMFGRETS